MPTVPAGKPRMRQAQHHREDAHPEAKQRQVGTDPDAHTDPTRKHKLGGNIAAHMGPVKKQKFGGNTDPVKKQKLGGDLQAYMDTAVQGLRAASSRDERSSPLSSHAKDRMVQTEQDLTWSSPTQAKAPAGTIAASRLSSWKQPLFSDLDRAQHTGRGPAKKAGKQVEPGRPQKRVQMYESIRASQRCGYCKTCLNRSMKKACLTRRAEMGVAWNVVG